MLVYGRNACLEYLLNGKVKKVYLQKDFSNEKILKSIKQDYQFVDKFTLDKMCDGIHQGIAIEVDDFKYSDIYDVLDKEICTLVMLDHLEDPHNLGAIIRTCEAFGIDGVIIPKDRSVLVNSTVIKTSVGTALNVPVYQVTNLVDTINLLKKNGFWVIGTDMEGVDYKKVDFKGKSVIIIGNEGKGISNLVEKNCDIIATIPMYGNVNSLNASVASGVILYEASRQNREGNNGL